MTDARQPLRVGMLGCGDISGHYLENSRAFPEFSIVSCADLDTARAHQVAEQFGLAVTGAYELPASPDVDLVLNLTPPAAHAAESRRALDLGKHVYSEKPLATTLEDALDLAARARDRGLALGAAPDTFLGPPYETARALLADGAIGEPVGVFMAAVYGPPELWHPNPEFLYQPGAGPLFDMGPYYLHLLMSLLGPVRSVRASATIGVAEREIGSGPSRGKRFPPATPTHISALLALRCGVQAVLLASFDTVAHALPRFEVYGTRGTLSLPDPDGFDGPLRLHDGDVWRDVPMRETIVRDRRGLGLADLARQLAAGTLDGASMERAVHAVDVMTGILRAAESGGTVAMQTGSALPRPAHGVQGS